MNITHLTAKNKKTPSVLAPTFLNINLNNQNQHIALR